ADAIESARGADLEPHYTELVRHLTQAATTNGERALKFAQLAAEQADRRLAYDEAAAHWRAALHAYDYCEERTVETRIRLLLELASSVRSAGDMVAGTLVQDEALVAAERAGTFALIAEAARAYGRVALWQSRPYATIDERVVAAIEQLLAGLPEDDTP